MAKNTRTFTDIDLNFLAHPVTKDVTVLYDVQAIKGSIRNLVLTSNYEKPFHPEIGSPIKSLLFEPATPLLPVLIQKAVHQTIDNFEPRVNLVDVRADMSPDNNAIYVTIEFKIVNTSVVQSVNVILTRTR
jgi:phage baseplate assembly protein W